jgi:hypothetical protein
MESATFAAIAATVSAICALYTLYMFRAQGKGFVWTKDHTISLITNIDGKVHIGIDIPLYNFGKGNIRFLKLKAKKINLTTKAMENFEMDMDEAYFPEGVIIITYHNAIQTYLEAKEGGQIVIASQNIPQEKMTKEYQDLINKHISEIPEHIIILKSTYKDGSWFGLRIKETVIGLSIKGINITYLSKKRRKELNEYFAW